MFAAPKSNSLLLTFSKTSAFHKKIFGEGTERDCTLEELLRRPEIGYRTLGRLPGAEFLINDPAAADQVETQVKYQGYIERQQVEITKLARVEHQLLPAALDYGAVRGLSNEVRQRLTEHRPETLGQASRISGITPAAISLLLVHLRRLTAGRHAADSDIASNPVVASAS